jgi:hypothetical protein
LTLFATLFALASFAHTGLVSPTSGQATEGSVVFSLVDDLAMGTDHGAAMPAKHLPGQPHDAKSGNCGFCGVVPVTAVPSLDMTRAEETEHPLPLAAPGLSPPLPPPRLHA